MNNTNGRERNAVAFFAYGLLLVPTALGAWINYLLFSIFLSRFGAALNEAPIPPFTALALETRIIMLALPWLIIGLAIAAWRTRALRHPVFIASVGSSIALYYLFFAMAVALPWITVTLRGCGPQF